MSSRVVKYCVMRIEKYLNTTQAEVEGNQFNVFLGLSLGNRYWTSEHIWAFLLWALKHSKEKFASNPDFRKTVVDAVKDVPHIQTLQLDDSQCVRLTKYMIDEMSILLNGFRLNGIHYDLIPYPGLAKIDYVREGFLYGVPFPEITRRLNIQTKVGIVEAYAD